MRPHFCKMLESVQDNLDTRKVGESTAHSRLSEPDTVSDLYGIDYTESLTNLLSYRHLELQTKDADYDWLYLTKYCS